MITCKKCKGDGGFYCLVDGGFFTCSVCEGKGRVAGEPKPVDPDAGAKAAHVAFATAEGGEHDLKTWRAVAEAVRRADKEQGR